MHSECVQHDSWGWQGWGRCRVTPGEGRGWLLLSSYFTPREFLGLFVYLSHPIHYLITCPASVTQTQETKNQWEEEAKLGFMILGASQYFVPFNSSFKDGDRVSPDWKPQLFHRDGSQGHTWAARHRRPGYSSLNNYRLFVSHNKNASSRSSGTGATQQWLQEPRLLLSSHTTIPVF